MKKIKEKTKIGNRRKGFTIVELLVAISIFVTLVTVATGAFVRGIQGQRNLVDLMAVADNAGIVLEQIAREVRTGYLFCGDGTVACGGELTQTINFKNHEDAAVTYSLSGSSIVRTVGSNSATISAGNVQVKNLRFIIAQAGNICNPWRITILMDVGSNKVTQTIPLQTTISSRVLPREVPGISEKVIAQCGIK